MKRDKTTIPNMAIDPELKILLLRICDRLESLEKQFDDFSDRADRKLEFLVDDSKTIKW